MASNDWSVVSETPVASSAPAATGWEVVSEAPIQNASSVVPAEKTTRGFDVRAMPEQFKSGVAGLQQSWFANTAKGASEALNLMDRIDRGERIPPAQDPLGYQDSNPEQRAKLRAQYQKLLPSNIAKTIAYGAEQQGYTKNPNAEAMIRAANKEDWRGAWKAFSDDPAGVIQQLSVQSLPNVLPSLAGGAVGVALRGGVPGLMAGLATGSFPVEYMASLVESLQDAGVNMKDAKAVEAKLRDPAFLKTAGQRAVTRGSVIAATDALSGKVITPLRPKQLGRNVARGTGNVAKEVGLEGSGEALAQGATGEWKPGDILAETLGAGPQAVASTALSTAQAARSPAATPPRVEPSWEVTGETPSSTVGGTETKLAPKGELVAPPPKPMSLPSGVPLGREQIEAKIAENAKYMPEEDARRVVMDELLAAEEASKQSPPATTEAQRLQTLILERIDAGVPPQQAAIDAARQLQQEEQMDRDAQGEQDVGESVVDTSGEGAGLAGVTPAGPAPGGFAGTQRDGVVPTGTDVGGATAREGQQPDALNPQIRDLETEKELLSSRPLRVGETSFVREARLQELQQQIDALKGQTAPQAEAPVTPKPAPTGEQLGTQASQTVEAKAQGPAEQTAQPVDTAQADEQNRQWETKKAKVSSVVKSNFDTAVDQVGDYNGDIDAAFDSYRANALDTLAEEGFTKDPEWDDLSRMAYREFDALVAGYKAKQAPAPKTDKELLSEATDDQLQQAMLERNPDTNPVSALGGGAIEAEINRRKAAPATAPAPAPAPAPAAPAGKRGRKPLPPEQKAKAEERRKEQRREANAADREVTRMEEELAAAKEELDPSDFPDATQFSEAKISQGMRRKRALAALYDFSRTNKNKPGQRAKAALEAEATAKEIEDIAKGYTLRRQAARKISTSQKNESLATEQVNERYTGVTTGLQAIGVLLRSGTIFQKFMAARIRNAVRNVKVVVLEKDDALPAQLSTDMARSYWDTARALYIYSDADGTHTVYLRGASFGIDQGINNVTVLHELLHAATSQKIQLALRLMAKGLDSNAPLVQAVQDLRSTMSAAADRFIALNKAGRLPKDVAELYARSRGAIFTDVREFVSYGLTDVGFQRFLNNVSDVIEPSETFFSRFVDAIRNMFGVPEDMHTAMTNLVNATDKIIASNKTARMRIMEANDRTLARVTKKQSISPQDKRTLNEKAEEVDEALTKFQKSKTAEEAAENVGLLHSLRRWDDFKQYFNSIFNTVDAKRLEVLLAPAPTDVVASWGSRYIPELKNTNNLLIDMRNMQHQLVSGAAEVSDSMVRAIKEDPSLSDKLAEVMSVSTDVRIDPDVDPSVPKLTRLFNALGSEGQRVYREVRDYYARMLQLYTSLLDAQIQEANLPPEAKNALMAQIKKQFETDKKIVPYFPFVRNRGPYWLRVKLGTAPHEFYMLGSIVERDAVAAAIAKEQGTTVEEMYRDGEFDSGDSVESLRKTGDTIGLNDKLKNIFNTVDNMTGVGPAEKDDIKNAVYELYLMTMPEQSFRKSFVARKDTVGYSTDVIRAFATSSLRFANQIPRIKYNQKLRNSLVAARRSLAGNPDKSKLERFVDQMDRRVGEELSPNVAKGGWESAVDFATRLSFIHYLSSAGSAIIQGIGLLYGASTLGARHGYASTALELGKIMRIWGEFSVIKRNSDGSVTVTPPSIANSKRVNASPMERRAIREVFGAITEPTLSSEILGRGRVSTAKFEGRGSAVGRGFNTVVGGLFHTIERLTRETIFAASFRLSLNEGKKKGLRGDDLFNYAKQQAIADVYDSVGNLSQENRAPMFKGAAGRFLLQFLHQPIFITIRWMQEFKRMLPFMGNEAKFQAFKEFAGIMGTTFMLGGVAALPFAKEMAGFIAAAFDDWDEEDKPQEMRDMRYWTWWANVWLPQYLGKVGIFGKSLKELTSLDPEELAAVITRGPTNAITGRDISSRVSINPTDMLFGPGKETRTTREGAIALAVDKAGPSTNLVLSYMDAYDAWQNGDMQKTMEKLLPAVARNVVVAEKYRKEGVKDYKGNTLITADSYTKGDYLYQLIGLRPDNLANHQNVLFEMSKGENKIRFERENLIRNIRDATLKNDNKRLQMLTNKQNKFNARYPEYEVTQENIDRSIGLAVDELSESFKGFRPTEKNERIFAPTAVTSGRALAKSQEKKNE